MLLQKHLVNAGNTRYVLSVITEPNKKGILEMETTESPAIDQVIVRVLPDGRMDRENAARYLGRRPKTLAMWTLEGKGPPTHKAGGRVFYLKRELDEFLGIEAAA